MAFRIIDLSHTLSATGMSVWSGHPSFSSYKLRTIREHSSNVTTLSFGSHTGTHIDAPSHFITNGSAIDELDLQQLFGRAVVVDVRGKEPRERIVWEDMRGYEGKFEEGAIVLICTGWSRYWGTDEYRDHPYPDLDVARKLVERGIKVIGVDTFSPDELREGRSEGENVHRVILGAGGMIAENLTGMENLIGIERPVVSLLPIKIGGCDGAPIRVVAFEGALA